MQRSAIAKLCRLSLSVVSAVSVLCCKKRAESGIALFSLKIAQCLDVLHDKCNDEIQMESFE